MADARKRKRARAFYVGAKRKKGQETLSPGMKGVLISCNERENRCVAEAYNVLNEYGDRLYGPEQKDRDDGQEKGENDGEDVEDEEESVEEALAREVKEMKEAKATSERRFQSVLSGANNVVFIKTNLPDNKDPYELVHSILTDIVKTGCKKTRHCLRFMPIAGTCYAKMEEITQLASKVLHPFFFEADVNPSKFCVTFKARNNSQIKRDDVISTIASLVMKDGSGHTVDLKSPDLTICVEIIKTVCCMSILRDFFELKRYNIHEVTEKAKEPDGGNKERQDGTDNGESESNGSGNSEKREVKHGYLNVVEESGQTIEIDKKEDCTVAAEELEPPNNIT